jgi:hypothetical protein
MIGQEETSTVTIRLKHVGLPEGTVYRSARQTRIERAPLIRSFQSWPGRPRLKPELLARTHSRFPRWFSDLLISHLCILHSMVHDISTISLFQLHCKHPILRMAPGSVAVLNRVYHGIVSNSLPYVRCIKVTVLVH